MPPLRSVARVLLPSTLLAAASAQAQSKPRLLVTTDIGGDPDDQQSMRRLLLYANELEITGLIASSAGTPGELPSPIVRPDLIHDIVDDYEVVQPNLAKHAAGSPLATTLRARVKSGSPERGVVNLGAERSTEGSNHIIATVDASTSLLYVAIWGGAHDLAQALYDATGRIVNKQGGNTSRGWSLNLESGGYASFQIATSSTSMVSGWGLLAPFPAGQGRPSHSRCSMIALAEPAGTRCGRRVRAARSRRPPPPTPGTLAMHTRLQRSLASLVLVLAGLTGSACGDETESPATNTPPTLTGPTVPVGEAAAGEVLTLTLAATDPDGDALTYAWVQTPASPAGTFSDPTAASPTWTAPTVTSAQQFTLAVTVTDGKGGSAEGSVTVSVSAPPTNQPPTVAATISAPGMLLAGATGTFSITASDPDGDSLTYAWEQQAPAAQGTWVSARTGNSAQWYSPAVGAQTSFTLSVSVTDGKSAPVVRTVTVPVTVPRYAADIQPVWSVCTSCHGGSGGLSLAAASSYSNLVNVTANVAACNTLSRVKPGTPEDSVLIRKLEGTACGNRMPRNNPVYFNDNPGLLVRVRSWILAGATND